jgi:hypothetical protein
MQCSDIICGILGQCFAVFAIVMMSVVCIVSGCVAYVSIQKVVHFFSF